MKLTPRLKSHTKWLFYLFVLPTHFIIHSGNFTVGAAQWRGKQEKKRINKTLPLHLDVPFRQLNLIGNGHSKISDNRPWCCCHRRPTAKESGFYFCRLSQNLSTNPSLPLLIKYNVPLFACLCPFVCACYGANMGLGGVGKVHIYINLYCGRKINRPFLSS